MSRDRCVTIICLIWIVFILCELLILITVLDGKFNISVLIIFNFVAAEKIKYGLLKTNNKLFFSATIKWKFYTTEFPPGMFDREGLKGEGSGGSDFFFYPSAIKAVGYSDHQRRAVVRAGRQKFSSY